MKGKLREKKNKLIEAMNPDRYDLKVLLLNQKDMNYFIQNRDRYLEYIKKIKLSS